MGLRSWFREKKRHQRSPTYLRHWDRYAKKDASFERAGSLSRKFHFKTWGQTLVPCASRARSSPAKGWLPRKVQQAYTIGILDTTVPYATANCYTSDFYIRRDEMIIRLPVASGHPSTVSSIRRRKTPHRQRKPRRAERRRAFSAPLPALVRRSSFLRMPTVVERLAALPASPTPLACVFFVHALFTLLQTGLVQWCRIPPGRCFLGS